jgi:hypothetical protein
MYHIINLLSSRFPHIRLGRFKVVYWWLNATGVKHLLNHWHPEQLGMSVKAFMLGLEGAYREYLEGVQGKA